jgi:TonB family protein
MRFIIAASLLSSITLTAAAATSNPANDAAASNVSTARAISTGVVSPVLVHSSTIEIPASEIPDAFPNPARVVLNLKLDETGTPTEVKVLRPVSPAVDDRVVAAVRAFRWTPALLDNQKIPINMKLVVDVNR